MCGIVGYVGNQQVVPVVIEGLRRLEYRGYDSAGIAVVNRAQSLYCTLVIQDHLFLIPQIWLKYTSTLRFYSLRLVRSRATSYTNVSLLRLTLVSPYGVKLESFR